MEVKLCNLVSKTIFFYKGQKYQMDSDFPNLRSSDAIGEGKFEFKCAPFFGEQFQTKMMIKIGSETIVTVSTFTREKNT